MGDYHELTKKFITYIKNEQHIKFLPIVQVIELGHIEKRLYMERHVILSDGIFYINGIIKGTYPKLYHMKQFLVLQLCNWEVCKTNNVNIVVITNFRKISDPEEIIGDPIMVGEHHIK